MTDPAGPKAGTTPRLPPAGGGGRGDQNLFPPIGSRERGPPPVSGSSPSAGLPDIGAGHRTSPLASTPSSRSSSVHQAPPVSPTKLPNIVKKSSSISNLTALASVRRTASLPAEGLRADLCRSPSCPALWSCDLNDDHLVEFQLDALQNGDVHREYPRRSRNPSTSDSPTKLPSIFGGSSVSSKSVASVRRSTSLQSRLSNSLVDNPIIGTSRNPRTLKRETSTLTALSMPLEATTYQRTDVSPGRRSLNPMLLPMREGGRQKLKRSGSKKGGTTPGTVQASEGTSGDSGVSVGFRPSDRSDSSAAQDGSEQGVWGAEVEVEVEMDDETLEGNCIQDPTGSNNSSSATKTPPTPTNVKPKEHHPATTTGGANSNRKPDDHRTALSAEKCREWLEGVSDDGSSGLSTRDKKAFKMPKIN